MSAATRLVRALETSARAAGCAVRVAAMSEQPWASATFSGARHAIVLRPDEGAALDAWLTALPDADLAVPGHVVADLTVERDASGVRLTVLMLEL